MDPIVIKIILLALLLKTSNGQDEDPNQIPNPTLEQTEQDSNNEDDDNTTIPAKPKEKTPDFPELVSSILLQQGEPKCLNFKLDLLDNFLLAQGLLSSIKEELDSFQDTDYVSQDFVEYKDNWVAPPTKDRFENGFTSCYRRKGDLFRITSEAKFNQLREITTEPIWQEGIKVDKCHSILYPGVFQTVEIIGNNAVQLKIPEQNDPAKCKTFDSSTKTFGQADCKDRNQQVCEITKTQDLLNLKHLQKIKNELLSSIKKVMDFSPLSPKMVTFKKLLYNIPINQTRCSKNTIGSLAEELGVKPLYDLLGDRMIGIKQIASIGKELLKTLKFIEIILDAEESSVLDIFKFKIFKSLNIELFRTADNNSLCGCQFILPPITENHYRNEIHKHPKPKDPVTDEGNNLITHEYFDLRFFELMSLIFSSLALTMAAIQIICRTKKEHNLEGQMIVFEDLEDSTNGSYKIPPILNRHSSLPNIVKRVQIKEPIPSDEKSDSLESAKFKYSP